MVSNLGMSARLAPQEDLDLLPSGVVEALDPIEAADDSPFPALGPEGAMADPLATLRPVSQETQAEGPPPLPETPPALPAASPIPESEARATNEKSGHLRLVSEPRPEPAPAAKEEAAAEPKRRRPPRAPSRARSTSGRAFGTNPPRTPTPPPVSAPVLKAELDEWTPPLRREESVIQEAAALRGGNLQKARSALSGLGARAMSSGLHAATRVGEVSVLGLRRFEKLPRRAQVAWVVAPYALAALVALVLTLRSGEPEEAPAEATLVSAPVPAEAPAPVTAAPVMAAAPVAAAAPTPVEGAEPAPSPEALAEAAAVHAAATAKVAAALQVALPTPAPAGEALAGEAKVLPRTSALYRRPDGKRAGAVPLSAGTALQVFPSFPAPQGWTLALTGKGTVGYLSLKHLADQADPALDGAKKKSRRKRR
jgi:hypothetical protein